MPEGAGSAGVGARTSALDWVVSVLVPGVFGGLFGYLAFSPYLPPRWVAQLTGLPMDWMPLAYRAFAAALFGGAGIVYLKQRGKVRVALQRVARQEGGQVSAAGADVAEKLRSDFLGDNSNDSMSFGDVLRESVQGGTLVAGELTIVKRFIDSDSSQTKAHTQTAAYFESAGLQFPHFVLQPRGALLKIFEAAVGARPVDFPRHPEFTRRYDVSGTNPERARAFFSDDLVDYLERHHGLTVRASGSAILLYRDKQVCTPEQIEGFLAQAKEMFRLLSEAARGFAAMPQPKMDPKADAQKLTGLIGKVVRAKLVTREDVGAFMRQAPPRPIPPAIRRYCDRCGPKALTVIGIAFALAGGGFALSFAASGQWPGALLGLLFVAVGTPAALFSNRGYSRARRLLRQGEFAAAAIEKLEDTRSWGSDTGEVYELGVRFSALGQARRATCRISGHAPKRAQRLVAEKKPAPILYDPGNPERILYLDDLLTVSPEYD